MNTLHRITPIRLFAVVALAGLLAAACSPTPTPTAVKSLPTLVVTKAAPTAVPTKKVEPTTLPKATVAPTQAQATPAAKLGTSFVLGDLKVEPTKVQQMATIGADKPKAGDTYEIVTLTIENTGKTSAQFNPASLVLLDPTGTSISATALKSLSDQLAAQSLKPGAKVTGSIAFEVPLKASGLELQFNGPNNINALWSLVS